VDLLDGHRVEIVQLRAPVSTSDDEPGFVEDRQVLHHPESAQVGKRVTQHAEWLSVGGEQRVQQCTPIGVAQRFEDPLIVSVALIRRSRHPSQNM
jgi:hypothetical protein